MLVIAALIAAAAPVSPPTDAALYQRHAWFELAERSRQGRVASPLHRGAAEAAMGDIPAARRDLTSPHLSKDDVLEAESWLSYIDMREGRYRSAAQHIARSAPGPNPLADTFRRLPDQAGAATGTSEIRYRILQEKLFLPMTVNGRPCEYILDSDANLSFVSEGEAKRLGLKVEASDATTAGALGAQSKLRIASADTLVVGSVTLRHVAFLVLPDDAPVFPTLAPGQRGAVGLPVLAAFRAVRWSRDGRFVIDPPPRRDEAGSKLAFDGADPIVQPLRNGRPVPGVFDTGAEHTALWPPMLRDEPALERQGKKSARHVRGFGGEGDVAELKLPSFSLSLGGRTVTLAPAGLLTKTTTADSEWLYGRYGLDLLRQAEMVEIDFRTLRLRLR